MNRRTYLEQRLAEVAADASYDERGRAEAFAHVREELAQLPPLEQTWRDAITVAELASHFTLAKLDRLLAKRRQSAAFVAKLRSARAVLELYHAMKRE